MQSKGQRSGKGEKGEKSKSSDGPEEGEGGLVGCHFRWISEEKDIFRCKVVYYLQ